MKEVNQTTQELKEGIERLLESKHKRLEELHNLEGIQNTKKIDNLRCEILLLQKQLDRLSAAENVEAILNEVHQYIPLAKGIIGKAQGDLSVVIKLLLNAGIDITKELDGEISTISKMSAKRLFHSYKDLCDAGFGKAEAFRIILAKIKPISFSEILTYASQSAKSAKS